MYVIPDRSFSIRVYKSDFTVTTFQHQIGNIYKLVKNIYAHTYVYIFDFYLANLGLSYITEMIKKFI